MYLSSNSNNNKKPDQKKPTSHAILIKTLGGRSFAEVLGQIKTEAKPEQRDTVIKFIRRTQNGDVLLDLGKSKDKPGFTAALKNALGYKGSTRALYPKTSVEIGDLEGLSSESGISEAIKKQFLFCQGKQQD